MMGYPEHSKTAIVLVDPLNDFLHPDGKLYSNVSDSLTETGTNAHLRALVLAARKLHIPIFYALHQGFRPGGFTGWEHMNASLTRVDTLRVFEEGSFGAEISEGLEPDTLGNGDVVVSKHWNSSGFANTDLDYQLRQRGKTHLVMAGMVANTCLESTARYGRELGYHITLLHDATAGFSVAAKDAALKHVWPIIAEEVLSVGEWIKAAESGSRLDDKL